MLGECESPGRGADDAVLGVSRLLARYESMARPCWQRRLFQQTKDVRGWVTMLNQDDVGLEHCLSIRLSTIGSASRGKNLTPKKPSRRVFGFRFFFAESGPTPFLAPENVLSQNPTTKSRFLLFGDSDEWKNDFCKAEFGDFFTVRSICARCAAELFNSKGPCTPFQILYTLASSQISMSREPAVRLAHSPLFP